MEGTSLSNDILVANVILTKIIYNIALSSLFIYSIEMQSRELKGREARNENDKSTMKLHNKEQYEPASMYYWTAVFIAFLFCYLIFDAVWTYDLYFNITQ